MAQKTSNMAESCSPVDCQSESVKQPKVPAARNFMQKNWNSTENIKAA